ncbi:MAG: DUF3800 domain-containing protein [Bosea sp. (in: a-proteobacteria)]
MYRLYVDEVGSDDLVHLDKDKHRYLSLSGVAMRVDHARDYLEPALNKIKADVFKHDPDFPIILHRKEIMGLKGPFGVLRDDTLRTLFNGQLKTVIRKADYTFFTTLIDKQWMVKQKHWRKNHPYHYLMELLIERYTQFLERNDAIGDIMPEARLGKKDELLQLAFAEVKETGSDFVSNNRIHRRIPSSNLKFRTKKDNIAGLQFCDLLAHPSHIYTRHIMGHNVELGPFANEIVDCLIEQKYDCKRDTGIARKIQGYGVKHLPQ